MKQRISGPVAIGLIVIVAAVIIGGLYMKFFYEKQLTPEESKAKMEQGMKMQDRYKEQFQNRANAAPGGAGR
jgi:uncharacterized membrane-anchored protein YhcB (DUF1043 family)